MVFQNDILAGASGAAAGYTIDQSIRWNSADSPYLTRTFSTDEGDTWTLSLWIKRGRLSTGNNQYFFSEESGASGMAFVTGTDTLRLYNGSTVYNSTPIFRDPSAWYHIVFSNNSGTWVCYVNGETVSGFTGTATLFNRNNQWNIGRHVSNTNHFNGYLAEIYWVGNQALAPTAFGETNDDGVWVPKAYAGSFGTNGFYLKGQDSSNLGDDSSGNGNDFTSSGLTSADQRADTPTNNMMTFNPLNNMRDDGDPTDGNRVFYNTGGTRNLCGTTFHFTTGKYVQAFSIDSAGTQNWTVGLMPSDETDVNDAPGSNEDLNAAAALLDFGTYYVGTAGSSANTGVTVSTADTMWVAYDADSGKQWVGIYDDSAASMVWFNSSGGSTGNPATGANPVVTGTANASLQFAVGGRNSRKITLLEESEATGTVPTGFTYVGALQDTYAAPAITDGSTSFNTILYTGDGSASTRSFTGVGFQPDFVWKKIRSSADHHWLHDAVRGATKGLNSNRTDTEYTSNRLTSFDSNGFSFATSDPDTNGSGSTYVAWNWLAGNGTASNEDGSIASTVSANTTAGFSVVSYTGNGTAGATVGHGLGVAPDMIIVKNRDNTEQWIVYHQHNGGTKYLLLNSNGAVATSSGAWNNTDPSSTVVTLGGGGFGTNVSSDAMIMYAFAEIDGFSKAGQYTGNGSADGPFVWCGFRPSFILSKENTSADDWLIYDSIRDPYNVAGRVLRPDDNAAEFDGRGGSRDVDFLSNGFKFRSSNGTMNGSGVGYIFMAFAEHPFGGNGVAPVPAR